MGQTAENVATTRGITRARQDEWGVASQNRAEAAIAVASSPRTSRR
jgi:acetyl-CoA C-acetyltransferase